MKPPVQNPPKVGDMLTPDSLWNRTGPMRCILASATYKATTVSYILCDSEDEKRSYFLIERDSFWEDTKKYESQSRAEEKKAMEALRRITHTKLYREMGW